MTISECVRSSPGWGVVKSLELIGSGPVGLVHTQNFQFFKTKSPLVRRHLLPAGGLLCAIALAALLLAPVDRRVRIGRAVGVVFDRSLRPTGGLCSRAHLNGHANRAMSPARIGVVFILPEAGYDINYPPFVPVAGGCSCAGRGDRPSRLGWIRHVQVARRHRQ